MFDEVKEYWKNWKSFEGRARRREYWVPTILMKCLFMVLSVMGMLAMFMSMDMVTGNFDTYNPVFWVGIVIFIGSFIFGIINCIAQISARVRRCHDIGKTGAVVALCFLPYFFIGDIAWYIVATTDSKEANQWGENPKLAEPDKYQSKAGIRLCIGIGIASVVLIPLLAIVAGFVAAVINARKQAANPTTDYNNQTEYNDYEYEYDDYQYDDDVSLNEQTITIDGTDVTFFIG